MLLISKPLFAICQNCIIFHFTPSEPSNIWSMSVRRLWRVYVMILRGGGVAQFQNYENRLIQNLLKMRFLHHLKIKKAWPLAQWGILEIGNCGIFSCLTYQLIRKCIYHNVCEYLFSHFTLLSVVELLFLLPKILVIFFKNTDYVVKRKTMYFISILKSLFFRISEFPINLF